MSNIGLDDKEDEFECSECDYKCSIETDIIEHSEQHRCTSITDKGILDNEPNNDSNTYCENYDPNSQVPIKNEKPADVNENDDFEPHTYRNKRESIPLEDFSLSIIKSEGEIRNKKIKSEHLFIEGGILQCKSESFLEENTSLSKFNEESEIENNKMKLEQLHIESEILPCFPPDSPLYQINGYNIHQVSNISRRFGEINQPESIYSADLEAQLSVKGDLPLSYGPVRVGRLEIEVDNSSIYVPTGWIRQVFVRTRLVHGSIKLECSYFAKQNDNRKRSKVIRNHNEAFRYHIKNPLADFDPEKLNFKSASGITWIEEFGPTHKSTWEFDVNNTDIYVPDGWKRKIKVSINSTPDLAYNVFYISPDGRRFMCDSEVYAYLSYFSSNVFIDVGRMSFIYKNRFETHVIRECRSK